MAAIDYPSYHIEFEMWLEKLSGGIIVRSKYRELQPAISVAAHMITQGSSYNSKRKKERLFKKIDKFFKLDDGSYPHEYQEAWGKPEMHPKMADFLGFMGDAVLGDGRPNAGISTASGLRDYKRAYF